MRRILVGLAVFIVGIAVVAILTARTSTPPILDVRGKILPGSIAEERYV